ncbi:putative mitochondrial hypothetical protein [Leptomonas pyrrhocoris]|uniref:Uncharacterized protein n=1 Tax=Leptomonas pyrrhocoris TaxID=157538 RepID=A0A0N0DV61_LEPPY|nr:putative mitochondrial hypothetical protein [Leptomonas pyrrhocoris]KPA79604.1 putative mitochondrial hypothetical protein [Leptomonas pyrrhocoris]|eukprot:XP_015658043.1 putative mitochondrial hypothetical protein [Leptomonas pyrrhocoris]
MKTTVVRCAASTRGRQRFQPSWMSPGLTSHQQLDAGVAARQQAGWKALKKSKRPFDNYFRSQFRFSPRVRLPVTLASGVVSSYDAVKMMTDPKRSWSTPWERGGSGARTRRKRQDVLEPTHTAFGEDAVDGVLERLIEIRFAWDREDGVLCTSLVPNNLYPTSAHCRPYVTEVAPSQLTSSTALTSKDANAASCHGVDPHSSEEDGEVIMIAGAPVRIQRRTPLLRHTPGQPKRPHVHSQLGFSGVDTVPSIVLDVSHGPFVTSPSAPLMTLRWKAEHRDAASAQSSLQLLRRVRRVPVVGLAPRSSFLLLKALSTVEVEEPALAVSLAIAMGENYNGYSDVECLEVLRCLRRLAFVRGLPELATPDINAVAVASSSLSSTSGDGAARLPRLYTEAALTDSMLAQYVRDAAPFLVGKIWGRLPEQSRHLLQRGYFLDWFDLMRLAVAASGPQRLPQRLPNPVSEAPFAAKYLFFHHTLGLKKRVLRAMVAAMRAGSNGNAASSPAVESPSERNPHQHTIPAVDGRDGKSAPFRGASPHFVDEVKEEVDTPLILWLCASLLVRIVAESLGDVVRHVGDLLYQHAALAAERAEEHEDEGRSFNKETPPSPSHKLYHPYPRFSKGVHQKIGCRKPKHVRVRLLPFEAFPHVAKCFSCPYASVTEKVEAQERRRHDRLRQKQLSTSNSECRRHHAASASLATPPRGNAAETVSQSGRTEMQSAFATVLAESPPMGQQVKRACAALKWSTAVLQACRALVRGLPVVPPPPVSVSCARAASSAAAAPSVSAAKRTRREAEADEWARETVSMEVRHALCYRYVRSAVRLHMDALFVFIPWEEMAAQWEPMLTAGSSAGAADTTGSDVSRTNEESSDGATFTADALEALLSGNSVKKEEDPTPSDSGAAPAPLSEAEQRSRAMMEELREGLEEFQVAVADVLEAHERFFEAPNQNTAPASP